MSGSPPDGSGMTDNDRTYQITKRLKLFVTRYDAFFLVPVFSVERWNNLTHIYLAIGRRRLIFARQREEVK
jgi:hypothetical protein